MQPKAAFLQHLVPLHLTAELTHRCPLGCPYCSNPVELQAANQELPTEHWAQVFDEAAQMGVLLLELSGGEPAQREDLTQIVAAGRRAGLHTGLVTSGLGLTRARLQDLADAGLEHVQLSMQGCSPDTADWISGTTGSFGRKLQVAEWVAELGLPLGISMVLHRQSLDQLGGMIDLAQDLGARRLVLETVRFHGWAALNRAGLTPDPLQWRRVGAELQAARQRLRGQMVIDHLLDDAPDDRITVQPDGTVLRQSARRLVSVGTLRERGLAQIWQEGPATTAALDLLRDDLLRLEQADLPTEDEGVLIYRRMPLIR